MSVEKQTTKKKRTVENRKTTAKGPLYPEGTPLDERGVPLENVVLTSEQVRQLGAFDPESARVTQQHRNTAAAKARGEFVAWNQDPQIALEEIYREHPNALIYISKVHPEPQDDNIPARPLSFIKNYEGLRKYIAEVHFNNKEDAVYQWKVRAPGFPQIGTGHIRFAKKDEDEMGRNGNGYGHAPPYGQVPQYSTPYPQYPQPQYHQQPYFQPQQHYPQAAPAPQPAPQPTAPMSPPQPPPPNGVGQPLPMIGPDGSQAGWLINGVFYAMAPPPMQAQQPQPQPPQPAPPPVPQQPVANPSQDFQTFLLTKLLEQNENYVNQMRSAYERERQAPVQQPYPYPPQLPVYPGLTPVSYGVPPGFAVGQLQPPQAQQPAPTTPAEPPAPPPSPIQVMQAQIAESTKVMRLQKEFTDTVRAIAGVDEEPPPAPIAPPAAPEDDFPLKTREINGVTVGSVDGEVVSTGEMALLNAPKILGIVTGFADKLFDRFEKVRTERTQEEKEALAKKEKEVELQERSVRAQRESQESKAAFEQKRLEIRAAHQYLDAQGQVVSEPPVPPPPPPPPPPPTAPATIPAEPTPPSQPRQEVPERQPEPVREPEIDPEPPLDPALG